MVQTKLEQLRQLIKSYGSCLVAYSGGVDSAFLAKVAFDVLGDKAVAVISDTPSLPRRDFDEAVALAAALNIPLRVVQTGEFEDPNYQTNPINRCYFCKHALFEHLVPLAKSEGLAVIIHGENASDVGDFRPGSDAAKEFHAQTPLKEVGLTKPEIRELSAFLKLPTAEKPAMACLSSRIPYGESVTVEKLKMIEQAEYVLRDAGFREVRVRHHELPIRWVVPEPGKTTAAETGKPIGGTAHLARIEVSPEEIALFAAKDMAKTVADAIKKIGYAHVTLDLMGYRRGSHNESLPEEAKKTRPAQSHS